MGALLWPSLNGHAAAVVDYTDQRSERFDDGCRVVIGLVRKATGAFWAVGPDGRRIAGPLDGGQWSTRGAAVAAIRETDIAVMHRLIPDPR